MKDWNTDAQFADVIDERFLGTNSQIDNFLSAGMGGKFLVVASKGMGKTLLLRHKRKHIEENHKDFVVIPRGQSADYVILPNSPTKGLLTLLEDHAFWQDLWTISIATSALLSFPHKLSEIERAFVVRELDRAELPITLEAELTNALSIGQRVHRNPSSILDILLQSEIKTIARVRLTHILPVAVQSLLTALIKLSIQLSRRTLKYGAMGKPDYLRQHGSSRVIIGMQRYILR